MAKVSYLQIITLNVNGLNAPSKRQRLAKWNTKTKPLYMLSTRDPPQKTGDTYRLKMKGWKNICHANGDQKKTGVAIFI